MGTLNEVAPDTGKEKTKPYSDLVLTTLGNG